MCSRRWLIMARRQTIEVVQRTVCVGWSVTDGETEKWKSEKKPTRYCLPAPAYLVLPSISLLLAPPLHIDKRGSLRRAAPLRYAAAASGALCCSIRARIVLCIALV